MITIRIIRIEKPKQVKRCLILKNVDKVRNSTILFVNEFISDLPFK